MPRPGYSTSSFLSHLFNPKRSPQPTGIRKVTLTGIRGGRRKGRLAAFNRMSPISQQILKESGQRDAYLRGEATLGEARKQLRNRAVSMGLARPPRVPPVTVAPSRRDAINRQVARHLKSTYAGAGKTFNGRTIDANVDNIPDYVIGQVDAWDYEQLKQASRQGSPFEYDRIEDGVRYNPFWYH